MGKEVGEVPLLRIEDATLVKNGKRILDGLQLTIAEGEHTAILGPNGSGKSSLIKLITRQHYPLARGGGKPVVSIFGRDRWNLAELRTLIGIVSSDFHQAFTGDEELYGMDAVLSGFFASQGIGRHHVVSERMRQHAERALAQVEASHLAEKPLAQMSTGEARRVLIARALVTGPRALLLDEPTAGLDMVAARRFLTTVRHLAQNGKTVILVTHDTQEIVPEIKRILLIKGGAVFRDGPKHAVLTDDNLSALFETPIRVRETAGFYTAEVQDPALLPAE